MKRKIIISLLLLFLVSASGAITAAFYIQNTTSTLGNLIQLHQIEGMRQHLVLTIQTVQAELYLLGTALGSEANEIAENVLKLEHEVQRCTTCHDRHSANVKTEIGLIQTDILHYQEALSNYITASANISRIDQLKMHAAEIGNRLQNRTSKMSSEAAAKLEHSTSMAMKRIGKARSILTFTILSTFLIGIFIAVRLASSVTKPVAALVDATRSVAEGNLSIEVETTDTSEFGKLARHFNTMTSALRKSYSELESEISDRRFAQDALTRSERFLSTIFDSIRDPFCIFDRDYRIVRVNDAYADLKNRTSADLLSKTCYEVLENASSICRDCVVQKTFLSRDVCAKEKQITTPSGQDLWLATYTYPIVDDLGTVTHVIEYTQDITPRKLAEQALKESEERYSIAAQGANDGLWDWDIRNNTVFYSPRWKEMLGYTDQEIGRTLGAWLDLVHPSDRPLLESRLTGHLESHAQHFQHEYRMLHKDGSIVWVVCRGMAIRDADGKAIRMAGSQTDITDRKKVEEQLVHDAFHDALTGLPNRALFLDRLEHVIAVARRQKDHLYAVLFIDLDRFKVINDSLGHTIGDKLLIAVGNRLRSVLRPGDTVARLGGDEFAVLLERVEGISDAKDIVRRIEEALLAPYLLDEHEVVSTQSIGIALKSDVYSNPEEILRDADIAMYEAKSNGRARHELFDSHLHASIIDRIQTESDLRIAIEHQQDFELYYQPIVSMQTRALTGFEALVRWNHPVRGLIYPMDFIPIAEETGMIVPLTYWIVEQACRQLTVWQQQSPLGLGLKISINISGNVLPHPDFVATIRETLDRTGLDPRSLVLEITETAIMAHTNLAQDVMNRLRDLGIEIHIDDFGTGYSSLSYLHNFPVTALKIDRSFIAQMTASENQEIIRTIVALAQNLSLDVIAEGIEEHHQAESVSRLNCQYGQGYLFARPMPAEAASLWMHSNVSQPS